MNQSDIIQQMTMILRDLLGDDSIVLERQTRRELVPNWDSFNYVTFMVEVEERFGIKFRAAEIDGFVDVGAISDRVAALRTQR